MNKISDITRQDILDIIRDGFVLEYDEPIFDGDSGDYITEKKVYMPFHGRLDEIGFFSRIYDLKALPSYDRRYRDALGDISCHLQWGDYEDFWFFQDRRFKLLQSDGDEPILKFICEMLHPAVRIEKSPWKSYLEKFNEILRVDGYELFAAQHISGRDIYKAREYTQIADPLLPGNLFTERYKELIYFSQEATVDNISGNVDYESKKHFCKVMFDFAEPMSIQRDRYDRWIDHTDALSEAISHLNDFLKTPVIDLRSAAFSPCPQEELLAEYFTPFVFDVIEFQYAELSSGEKSPFQAAINASFKRDRLSFRLSDRGLIELQIDQEVLTPEIIESVNRVLEPGIQALLNEAIEKHMQPSFQAHRDAVEKIWDALERLKTYYTGLDKKASVSKIVYDMASGNSSFINLFNAEFKTLTDIGNDYRIRHHETSKTDIVDPRHYDYFFNRCLSLIALALQYLQ